MWFLRGFLGLRNSQAFRTQKQDVPGLAIITRRPFASRPGAAKIYLEKKKNKKQ